jgi:hypothetical protein
MIYKLKFDDRTEYATAKNQLHLLQSYDIENEGLQEIEEVIEISYEEAKTIMLVKTDYDEDDPDDMPKISLYDSAVGDEFLIIGSTEWI